MTLQQHIEKNRAQIESEARAYAKAYGCTLDEARRDVRDEFAQGWHVEQDGRIYE